MRTTLLILLLAATSSVAHAERTTTINVGAMMGGVERQVDASPTMEPSFGPRITVAWEHPPLALPPTKGTSIDVSVVPELTAAALLSSDVGETLIGVGARAEVRMGQRDAGLLKINARFALYIAGRALLIGKDQDGVGEFAFGEYVYLGKGRFRVGGEIALSVREQDPIYMERSIGVFASAYVGFAL